MSFNLDENSSGYQIQAYNPGQIKINNVLYTRSLIITPLKIIENWEPQTIESLTQAHLQVVVDLNPEILLLGTGENLIFPSLDLYGEYLNQGIGIEIMNTRAACKTFNILVAENRNVVAALVLK